MKFLVLIYNDHEMLNALPSSEFESTMRGCLTHANENAA